MLDRDAQGWIEWANSGCTDLQVNGSISRDGEAVSTACVGCMGVSRMVRVNGKLLERR